MDQWARAVDEDRVDEIYYVDDVEQISHGCMLRLKIAYNILELFLRYEG
jgi:hypothetical protein